MEESTNTGSGKNEKQKYLHKLYLQQFAELRKLKTNRSLTFSEKVKSKRQIVIKYKNLRKKADSKFLEKNK